MRIFSGIQPTGAEAPRQLQRRVPPVRRDPGAGRGLLLHRRPALDHGRRTTRRELREATLDLAAMLFATGLDPERSTVFVQSHVTRARRGGVAARAVTSFGELRRMTQFKDKGEQQEFISAGLFTYPVLMAGDILLYQTDIVPVGDDQRQHLELARNVAERFNSRYGETFRLPDGDDPASRRADHGPPGAERRRCPRPAGRRRATVCMLDPPDDDPEEVQERGDRLGHARCATTPTKRPASRT